MATVNGAQKQRHFNTTRRSIAKRRAKSRSEPQFQELVGKTISRVEKCETGIFPYKLFEFTDKTALILKYHPAVFVDAELYDLSTDTPGGPGQKLLKKWRRVVMRQSDDLD